VEKKDQNRIRSTRLDRDALRRCGPGIRRLLQLADDEIRRAKKRDERRLQQYVERVRSEKRASVADSPADRRSYRRALRPIAHRVFGPVLIEELETVPIKIRAIVEFAGNADDLVDLGITVHASVQNVFTITATKEQLTTLASQPATQKIRLPRLFFPHLQDAAPTAEVDQVHAVGNRGNGTFVGVVDSPLHVEHHAFRDPAGVHGTRVQYYWVQDPDTLPAGGQPPGQTPEAYFNDNVNHPNSPNFTGLNYGRLYDAAYIDAALTGGGTVYGTGNGEIAKDPTTESEHGTHVAGIAAGSGHLLNWATAPVNIGSAPLADIVHVGYRWSQANLQDGVWEDDVVNGLDFIMRIAAHDGRPVVTNTSLGTNVGPHNGRSAFDQARNALLDSHHSRSMVFTAGNDNDNEGFRRGTVARSSTVSFDMDPNSFNINDIWVDIWYRGPDLDFKMDCGGGTTNWVTPPNEYAGTVNGYDVEVDRDVEPGSGLKGIRLYVEDAGTDWTINLRNPSGTDDVRYWAWVGGQGSWANLDGFTIDELTINDTGCARALLTVGACVKQVGANPEEIADYSGRGPTLDGRIKPELVAVGGTDQPWWIAAPQDYVQSADSTTNGGYTGMSGTSMAAPLTAGAVALLLEDQPTLNQDAIKGLLTQNADRTNLDIDPEAAGYDPIERNAYGYGRLRLLAPFQFIQPPGDIDVWVRTADDDYGHEPYPGGCFCHAPEIKVLDAGNNETTTLNWGQAHTVQVRIHNLGDGVAANTTVTLKYTRPWAAPDDWEPCQDAANNPIEEIVDVPALGYVDVTFTQLWTPEQSELPAGGAEWGDHYCLLVELDHQDDDLQYDDSTAAGRDPWVKNIKGTNNVALRNLHIH